MKKVTNTRKDRLLEELTSLKREIKPGEYRKFTHPFPEYLPEVGSYDNNIALIARFDFEDPTVIDGESFIGSVFEYCFIRDDRVRKDDESTKHINVDYRILGNNCNGDILQENYQKDDHFISPCASTSGAFIAENRNLIGLSNTGSVDDLVVRGILLDLRNANCGTSEKSDH